jgi:hypothetical protein
MIKEKFYLNKLNPPIIIIIVVIAKHIEALILLVSVSHIKQIIAHIIPISPNVK